MEISPTIRRWFFFALLAGIIAWLVCVIFHPFEPRYQGKRLTDWAEEVYPTDVYSSQSLPTGLRAQSARAVAVIQQIGTNALPLALSLCRTKDSWLKRKLEECTKYNSGGVVRYIITTEWQKHEEGANIIWALGSAAKPAIPALIQLLQSQDRDIAMRAVDALPGAGTNAIPPLIELLDSANQDVRQRAMTALGLLGRQAHAAAIAPIVVPAIVHFIQTETNDIYFWTLGNFGTNAESAVPVLTNILGSFQPPFNPPKPAALGALNRIDPEVAKPFVEKWRAARNNEFNGTSKPPFKLLDRPVQTNSAPP
jgi:HEAT repeats